MKKSLLSLSVAVLSLFANGNMNDAKTQTKYSHYYQNLPCAVEQVNEVVIPDYTVNLTDFGAVGDGTTDNTEAFAAALKHLKKQGGGHLIVPDGKWLTGPVKLIRDRKAHV